MPGEAEQHQPGPEAHPAAEVADQQAAHVLERMLARETLQAEQLRATLLAGLFASAFGFVGVILLFYPQGYWMIFKGRIPLYLPLLLLGGMVAYELTMRQLIGWRRRTGGQIPTVLRYLNAAFEISFPSCIILLSTRVMDPITALFIPQLFLYFPMITLSALRLDFRLCAFTGLVAGVEYMALALAFLASSPAEGFETAMITPVHHLVKALLLLATGLVTGLVTLQIKKQLLAVLASQEEKNRVVSMFGQHVSPEVVNKLLSQPAELGTEVRHVCVMFLDIRNFTRFSENTDPEEVVRYLNTLYDFMIEIVNRHHGIINKFLGDGFMAVFGAPLSNGFDSRNAVYAAQEILATLEQAIRTDKIPPTAVGIGLHAGEAVTGNVGSAQRKEYTIIGDVVNVASRIEQLNKQFGSQLLISETVWESLDQAFPDAIPHDPIPIRGRREAIRIYQMA